ncbi:MAG: peptidoglycan-associated lipoprotein Pal [Thermodesulfobacteriota bacterium]
MNGKMIKMLCVAGLMASLPLLSTGCAKKTVAPEEDANQAIIEPAATDDGVEVADTGDSAGDLESVAGEAGDVAGTAYAIVEGRTHEGLLPVYFDFDQSVIRADQQDRLSGNVAFLQANPTLNLTIEGNSDERGTNEYNVALGEKRAQSAKKYLIDLGVDGSRLSTVSYGEEKPLLFGHDEYSWSQNRRDDFVIN